jgi:starch-binding outer membrane protein SusE/F
MKTLKYSIFALVAAFATSCSSDDVENRPVVEANGAIELTAPEDGNAYVLSPETPDLLAERFTWTAADFGAGIIPNYEVEIDYAGENFDTPVVIGAATPGVTQFAASHNVLNTAVIALGATPFENSTFEVRVKAYVSDIVVYSNAAEINVTPYTTETPLLWVPGSYQAASNYGSDWTPADAPQLKALGYGDTHFEGYIYFAADATFKFTPAANWDASFGVGSSAGTLSATGGDIATTAGYYKVSANTDPETLTYSLTATSWGLIGSATAALTGGDGWGSDLDMTYDATTKKWSITTTLSAGEVKFRANDAWDLNYGDDGADASLNEGGANIAIPAAGTYLITLDLSSPRAYTYTVQAQ